MPNRINVTTLNARTVDVINTIRANASAEFQSLVPAVTTEQDIPKVGEILMGYPALANQFLGALMNRIALVAIKSASFNNKFSVLKKGYLGYGETVEEVFVELCKAREFSPEKAPAREFKRTIPDVKSAFHAINLKIQYPISISQEELRQAFMSADGVTNLITKIIDSIYTSVEVDEYLIAKYMLIKAIAHGKLFPVTFDSTDMKNAAKIFRGTSNKLEFISDKYNTAGVHTTTPKADQYIIMDAQYNADYDVDVLAAAFNMDRATFMGHLILVDDWTSFDNDRFSDIKAGADYIEDVTAAELALMKDVKAVMVDKEWYQWYNVLASMSETFVASGLYYNYFYNLWSIVSSSPFSNAIVYLDDGATVTLPTTITCEVTNKTIADVGTVITLTPEFDDPQVGTTSCEFIQTETATEAGIAVHKYGAIIIPANSDEAVYDIVLGGTTYRLAECDLTEEDVGDEVVFTKVV